MKITLPLFTFLFLLTSCSSMMNDKTENIKIYVPIQESCEHGGYHYLITSNRGKVSYNLNHFKIGVVSKIRSLPGKFSPKQILLVLESLEDDTFLPIEYASESKRVKLVIEFSDPSSQQVISKRFYFKKSVDLSSNSLDGSVYFLELFTLLSKDLPFGYQIIEDPNIESKIEEFKKMLIGEK